MKLNVGPKAFVSMLILAVLATNVGQMFPLAGQRYTSGAEEGSQMRDVLEFLDAPEGTLHFMYWSGASSDALAAKVLYEACRHPSESFYQADDQLVDANGCPRPEAFGVGEFLIFFGGPYVQPAVKYYEESGQTPVFLSTINSTHVVWTTRPGGNFTTSTFSLAEFDAHHDTFVLESFIDNYGRKVVICYGWGWQGTFAGATYLVNKMIPIIDQYTNPYYIFRWADTNNDYLPEVNEILEREEKYASVQAFLHWSADPETISWFANACHSRDLRVTWYVVPEYNSNSTSLLKSYKSFGDDIELSLGAIFFNKMTPEERLLIINKRVAEFKREFGSYPSLVEAYYIDAFSLNYIASRFQFISGAVGYVNHEEFCDGLKTAGAYYMPYYPSKLNAIVPGKGENRIPLVVLPFLQRDLSNNILYHDVRYNLCPQDGSLVVDDWKEYFRNLLGAYLNGWDQFGLAFYAVDLTFDLLPRGLIETDLDFIHSQTQSQNCVNILDKGFTEWFKTRFNDSPCYRWMYDDPYGHGFSSTWYFTYKERLGQVVGHLSEVRISSNGEEGCYDKQVDPYDNSFSSGS